MNSNDLKAEVLNRGRMLKDVILLVIVVLAICCNSCTSKEPQVLPNKTVTLIFQDYHPRPFQTPGGFKHLKVPLVGYIDSVANFVEFNPQTDRDTLIIPAPSAFAEVELSYRDFEHYYYPLMQGDSIVVTLDSLDFPILKSVHHPERNSVYNIHRDLHQERYMHVGLEASTCLGCHSFILIAKKIDYIRKMKWDNFLANYCPIDSLWQKFHAYEQAYSDTLLTYKKRSQLSDDVFQRFQYWLQLKKYEALLILNEDSAFHCSMEAGITDKEIVYPSYYRYLDHYLYFFQQHVPTIRHAQGGNRDWRQIYDELSLKPFQPRSRQILLRRCMEEICEYFSARDINQYLDKYLKDTQDTLFYNQIKEQYNLSADATQLILKDMQGKSINFKQLLKKYKGKVVYVDFWASWCVPCRKEMNPSAELRKEYEEKDIVFVYLAYNDTEDNWKKATLQEGMQKVRDNYLITNSKNSQMLERIKLELIPRYIVFDKQGNLVEMNAPRPSERHIKETIDKYLKQ